MELESQVRDDVLIVYLNEDVIDATLAGDFKGSLLEIVEKAKTYDVIIDLSALRFIDSSGLGALLGILRVTHDSGGDLKLAGMSATVQAMFQIVRMHTLFDRFPTVDEALRSFSTI